MGVVTSAQKKLEVLGATIVDGVELPDYSLDRKSCVGEADDINDYLASFPTVRASYQDICQSGRTQIYSNPKECLDWVESIEPRSSTAYKSVLVSLEKNGKMVETLLDKMDLYALLMPTDSHGPPDESDSIEGLDTKFASMAGLPAIAFIAGYTNAKVSMPVGMEFLGRKWSEGELINMANDFEKRGQRRIASTQWNTGPGNSRTLSLSIPKLNHLFTQIGWASYVQVLKSGKRQDLTPDRFKKVVEEIL